MISARRALSFLAIPAFLLALLASRPARAQLRWDASVQAGGVGRFFSNNANGVPGSIGPLVGVEGDVAIVPLLRLGGYIDYEYADTGEVASPSAVSFGGRVKVMIPGYRRRVHLWLFTGFGGVILEAPGYTEPFSTPTTNTVNVSPATGYFFEIPVGIGMGWRVHKPWEVVAELQGRFGFAMGGSYFTDGGSGNGLSRPATAVNVLPGGTTVPGNAVSYTQYTGTDVFALLLTVGIGLDD